MNAAQEGIGAMEGIRAAIAQGRLDEAEGLIDALPERLRGRPGIRAASARVRLGRAAPEEAPAILDALAAEGWDEPTLAQLRAEVAERRGDARAARAALAWLIELAPDHAPLRLRLAMVELRAGEPGAAAALVARARSLGAAGASLLRVDALVRHRAGDLAGAAAALRSLIDLVPGDPALPLWLSRILSDAEDLDAAREAVAAAEARGGERAAVLRQRLAIEARGGSPEAQAEILGRLVAAEPETIEHPVRLVSLLGQLGRREEATEAARTLARAFPEEARAYEIAFAALLDAGAPHGEVAELVGTAVARSAAAPRLERFLLMHLQLPEGGVARLVEALRTRWPVEYGPAYWGAAAQADPEGAILLDALDDRARARAAARALAAEPVPPGQAEVRARLPDVVEAMPDRAELRRALVVDDGSEVLESPPGTSGLTVLAFAGGALRLGYGFEVIDAFCARAGASAIYCRDHSLTMFLHGIPSLGRGREATVAALRDRLEALGTTRLVVVTSSGGGLGGLACALPLGPERVLMMSPQTEFSSASLAAAGLPPAMLDLVRRFEAMLPPEDLDLRRRLATLEVVPDIRIAFGAANPFDRAQAERVADLPGITLLPQAGWQAHAATAPLILSGELERHLLG